MVDAGTALCASGVNAALDLSLYLADKHCGREIAMQCVKLLLIETSRTSQVGFSVVALSKRHSDKAIMEAKDWIETNYPQNFTMAELASRYEDVAFFRVLFRRYAGMTPKAFYPYPLHRGP